MDTVTTLKLLGVKQVTDVVYETFEEFKEHILVGEPFEISITASLKPKEKETQYTKTK